MDSLIFWVMKPLAEIAFGLCIVLALLLAASAWHLFKAWKHRNCAHEFVHEDSACNAWCNHCGRNLGFIGDWREKQNAAAGDGHVAGG